MNVMRELRTVDFCKNSDGYIVYGGIVFNYLYSDIIEIRAEEYIEGIYYDGPPDYTELILADCSLILRNEWGDKYIDIITKGERVFSYCSYGEYNKEEINKAIEQGFIRNCIK